MENVQKVKESSNLGLVDYENSLCDKLQQTRRGSRRNRDARYGSVGTSSAMGPDAKPKPKVQKQIVASPGLRSMLYGLSMKLEREEKMQRKIQKKNKGKFHLKQALRNLFVV